MAGKRQHYIPRFLLKGFSSKTEGHKDFVWYFRKGGNPAEISIRDVAVSSKFYGAPGPETVDETITSMEQHFGPAIERLRIDRRISPKDLPTLVEFVVNMVIRTGYIRKSLTDATGGLLEMAVRNFSDPKKMALVLTEAIKQNKARFTDQLRSSLRSKLGVEMPAIEELTIRWAEENAEHLTRLLARPFSIEVVKGLAEFLENIEKQGAQSHKEALERFFKEEGPSERHLRYSSLDWIMQRYNPNEFILGDISVIEMDTNSHTFSPPIFSKKDDYALLLPMSHDTLLIGSVTKDPILPSPDALNSNSVEMSTDFFVSSVNSDRERQYIERIGKRANSWWEEGIEKIEKGHFGKL